LLFHPQNPQPAQPRACGKALLGVRKQDCLLRSTIAPHHLQGTRPGRDTAGGRYVGSRWLHVMAVFEQQTLGFNHHKPTICCFFRVHYDSLCTMEK